MHKTQMVAPCGINCSVCIAYLRSKNRCVGCNAVDGEKPYHCTVCSIKHCPEKNDKNEYCCKCSKFPCQKMKQLDKRYRTRYNTSLINNLKEIETIGIEKFIAKDNEKWLCEHCGSVISIHKKACLKCNKEYHVKPNFEVDDLKKVTLNK